MDEHVHYSGYDDILAASLQTLALAAKGWAHGGADVLLHSDHGQVRTECPDDLASAWARVESPAYCDGPAGGAGRVRWLHTRPGMAAEAQRILSDVGAAGLVVNQREQFIDEFGSLAADIPTGEVVVLATGSEFPLADRAYRYEHGSLTPEEMIVPLAVWHAG